MSTTLVLTPSSRALPFGVVFLRRARSVPVFVAAVTYAWLTHLGHLVRCRLARHPADAGMTTAEYAVGTVAACGFAALLYRSSPVAQCRRPCPS
jgi:hypothetical protein